MPPEAGLKTLVGLKGDQIWAIAAGATCISLIRGCKQLVTSTYEQTIVNLPPLMLE